MNCVYYYKDKTFNSELELDDFLLRAKKIKSDKGDIVFSTNTLKYDILNQLNKMRDYSDKAKANIKIERAHWYEDGMIEDFKAPYLGVTSFLSGLTVDDRLMFPEFREENYWNNRFEDWKKGNFKKDEIEVIFETGKPEPITDPNVAAGYADIIKDKWEQQGVIGTAIHKIFQKAFAYNNSTKTYYVDTFKPNDINVNKNIKSEIQHYLNDINNGTIDNNKQVYMEGRKQRGLPLIEYKDVIPSTDVIVNILNIAKQLKENLITKYGTDDLSFYPEFGIGGDLNQMVFNPDGSEKGDKIRGTIDLLVVDNTTGRMHIIDYKTSPKDYNSSEYASAKIRTFEHQLATYNRLLGKYGVDIDYGDMMVVPIQIQEFTPNKTVSSDKGDRKMFSYSNVVANKAAIYDDLTLDIKNDKENSPANNISSYIDIEDVRPVETKEILKSVVGKMKDWFGKYNVYEETNREELIEELKDSGILTPNEEGKYIYKKENGMLIKDSDEGKFIDKILLYRDNLPKRQQRTKQIINALKIGISEGDVNSANWPYQYDTNGTDSTWFQNNMAKYCNNAWEVIEDETLISFGMIPLKNKISGQVDVVKITTKYVNHKHCFGDSWKDRYSKNRNGLTGKFALDIQEKSKANSLMLEATTGNMEAMESLLVLNYMKNTLGKDITIGNILVANTSQGKGVNASNEELLYCYKALNKYSPVSNDSILNNNLKFASKYELVYDKLSSLIALEEDDETTKYKRFGDFATVKDMIQEALEGNSEDKIKALMELLDQMKLNKSLGSTVRNVATDVKTINEDYTSLYNSVLLAIADLKGVKFRQQIVNHKKWLESAFIWKHGMSGTYLDNPGNLSSETLNLITKLVTEAYQNVRQDMQGPKYKFRELVKALKEEKSYSWLKAKTVGNDTSLYSNMWEHTKDGDFIAKRLDSADLSEAERNFLEYFLDLVNRNRFPKATEKELEKMKNSGDSAYYRIPLCKGGAGSVAVTEGLLNTFKDRIRGWMPKEAWKRAKDTFEGFVDADDSQNPKSSALSYEMNNIFDRGNGSHRMDLIESRGGLSYFEHNLETVGLKFAYAYTSKKNLDEVFPLIKAAVVHLSTQGANQNTVFQGDLDYIKDYVNANIKSKSILSEQEEVFAKPLNMLKRAASTFSLAMSPVQFFYQTLQGLWIDISLMIRKPDGTNAFTFDHMKASFKQAYKDLFKDDLKPSICSELNELYAMNDMDMNTYSERIKTDRGGIFNLTNLLFKFASRPDFYNRLTIFGAQMRGDGSWDAHSMVDGKLVYDWTKDKRFEAFANDRKSDPEYNKQKALYYAMAKQFVIENATNADGSKFVLDMVNKPALPRAYTNQQAESMKSLADNIYGYYSHEKKSMIHSTLLGSMWMQFRTYWSGKKNQYLGTGGVKIQGKMVQYKEKRTITENGVEKVIEVPIYYKILEDGTVTEEMTEEDTGFPVYRWEGDWQEGIFVTIFNFLSDASKSKSFKSAWKDKWYNEDPKLRTTYRSNIMQLGYDLSMWIVGGVIAAGLMADWYDELEEDADDSVMDGLKLSAAKIAVYSVRNSFEDFKMVDSISDPFISVTPFSIEWISRQSKSIWRMLKCDQDVYDGMVNMFSATKQIKPFMDTIKPEWLNYDEEK